MLTYALSFLILVVGLEFSEATPIFFDNVDGISTNVDEAIIVPLTFKAVFDGLVSDDERTYFLIYHLAHGFSAMERNITQTRSTKTLRLPEDLDMPKKFVEKIEKMNIPKNQSVALYQWVSTSFKIEVNNTIKLLRKITCFPNGYCVNLDDVAGVCCPL